MSTKRLLFVSKDLGNAKAGEQVARACTTRGAAVHYGLDAEGAAWKQYAAGGTIAGGRPTAVVRPGVLEALMREADAVVVTLSASGPPNMEINAVRMARQLGKPVYGIEEVLRGRHNPGWRDGTPPPVRELTKLFTIMATSEDDQYAGVRVVGPPQLERYRGVNIAELGAATRKKLEIEADSPLVWYSGHPEPESPHALLQVGQAMHVAFENYNSSNAPPVLIVSRHSRDKGIRGNGDVHRHVLRLIASNSRVVVRENSPDHAVLPDDDPDAVIRTLTSPELATYQELVCACAHNGVIVTGFGTDGLVVAPYLGVLSILLLDEPGFLLGAIAQREKGCTRFPVRHIQHARHVGELAGLLKYFLYPGNMRAACCEALRKTYPFPDMDPADRIADIILGAMA